MVKNIVKNIFDGRRGGIFLSMECKVEIDSTYICRNCLSVLKKRLKLLTNVHEVNSLKKVFRYPLTINVIIVFVDNVSDKRILLLVHVTWIRFRIYSWYVIFARDTLCVHLRRDHSNGEDIFDVTYCH